MQCMSLHPEAIPAVAALNRTVTFGGSTLTRPQEEMIATTVSVINECDY
ncbi:MAG: carboxymuconolactone decarboxylase family protein [SAR324 cluster bacterium]|nr:carboxymuconolactone decarboxylase family protein [SAR324 cluster bacterium]